MAVFIRRQSLESFLLNLINLDLPSDHRSWL